MYGHWQATYVDCAAIGRTFAYSRLNTGACPRLPRWHGHCKAASATHNGRDDMKMRWFAACVLALAMDMGCAWALGDMHFPPRQTDPPGPPQDPQWNYQG